jgi:hypothetical protein
MVRGHCEGSRCGARGGCVTPPLEPLPEGSNPQGEEQVLRMRGLLHGMCWV